MSGRISDSVCPKCGDPACPGPDVNHHEYEATDAEARAVANRLGAPVSDERLAQMKEAENALRHLVVARLESIGERGPAKFCKNAALQLEIGGSELQQSRALVNELRALSEKVHPYGFVSNAAIRALLSAHGGLKTEGEA